MTNVLRSRFARPLVLAAAALIALGACGGDDDGGAGGEEPNGSTTLPSVFPTIPPVTTAPGTVTVAPVVTNPDGTPVAPTTVAPGSGQTSPPPPSTTLPGATTVAGGLAGVYTVLPNDYLAGIAEKLGVDYDELLSVNGFTSSSVIHPGDKIKVPSGGSATGDAGTGTGATTTAASSSGGTPDVAGQYTVVAGDCWVCIANKLGVDLDDLYAVNGASADTVLNAGDKIKVPTGGGSSTTAAETTTTTR